MEGHLKVITHPLRYTWVVHPSPPPPLLFTFHPNLSILLYAASQPLVSLLLDSPPRLALHLYDPQVSRSTAVTRPPHFTLFNVEKMTKVVARLCKKKKKKE